MGKKNNQTKKHKKKTLTVVQKPEAVVTNICSHCELMARDTTIYKMVAPTHAPPCKHTATFVQCLIYHFSTVRAKQQPGGDKGSSFTHTHKHIYMYILDLFFARVECSLNPKCCFTN